MPSLSIGAKLRVAYSPISSALPVYDKVHVDAVRVVDKDVAHCDALISELQHVVVVHINVQVNTCIGTQRILAGVRFFAMSRFISWDACA